MSPRDVGSLAFKLAGIYALVQAFLLLSSTLMFSLPLYRDDASFFNLPLFLLGCVISLTLLGGLGFFLIRASRRLAETTVLDGAAEGATRTVDVHAALFSVLGVFLIGSVAANLPNLLFTVHDYLSDSDPGFIERRKELLAHNWRWGAGALLQLLIGVALLLRARRLALYFNPTAVAAVAATASSSYLRCPKCDHPYLPESYREDAEVHACAHCGTNLRGPVQPKGA